MNLKNQLKQYLKEKKISASELARQAGVPKQSISDWLSGTNPRDIRMVKKIADIFQVSVDHLVFGEGVEPKPNPALVTVSDMDEWVSGIYEVRFRKIRDRSPD